nr:hypothetical protein CFP56_40205 [Quercus suber]
MWKSDLVQQLFLLHEAATILGIPLSIRSPANRVVWTCTSSVFKDTNSTRIGVVTCDWNGKVIEALSMPIPMSLSIADMEALAQGCQNQDPMTVQNITGADKTNRHRHSRIAAATDRWSRCQRSDRERSSDAGAVKRSEKEIQHR